MNKTADSEGIVYRKSARPWIILICCCLMQGLGFFVSSMMVSVFINPLMEALNTTRAPLLSYFSVQLIVSIFVLLFAGKMMKLLGAGKTVALGAILVGGAWILFALTPSLPMFYVTAALNGFYPLCCLFMVPVLINNWFHKNKGLWTSFALAFSGVASFIFSPVVTNIIANRGWTTASIMMGVIVVVVIVLCAALFIRISPVPMGILPWGATQEDVESMLANANNPSKLKLPGVEWKKAIRSSAFVFVIITMLLIGVLSAFNTNVNTLVQSAGHTAAVAGFAMSAAAVGQIIGKPISGAIKDRFGAGAGNAFGFGLTAAGLCIYIGVLFSDSSLLVYVAAFVTGTGITSTLSMPALITDDAFGLKDYETLYSIDSSARAIGLAIINPIVGILVDTSGSYLSGLVLWVIAAILVIPLCFIGVRKGQKLWKKS